MKTLRKFFITVLFLAFSMNAFCWTIGNITLEQMTKIGSQLPALTPAQQQSLDQLKPNLEKLLLNDKTNIPDGNGAFTHITSVILPNDPQDAKTFAFLGTGDNNQFGLYIYRDGKITTVLNQNTEIAKGAGFFTSIQSPLFNGKANQIAFIGNGILGQEGIYFYDGKKLIEAVDQRTIVPKQSDLFFNFTKLALTQNMILFSATGDQTKKQLYLFYYNKGIFKILGMDDLINTKKVIDFDFNQYALNQNTITLQISLADGSHDVYTAKIKYNSY